MFFALFSRFCFITVRCFGLQLKRTNLLDLGPYPDAVEYFAQANVDLERRRADDPDWLRQIALPLSAGLSASDDPLAEMFYHTTGFSLHLEQTKQSAYCC